MCVCVIACLCFVNFGTGRGVKANRILLCTCMSMCVSVYVCVYVCTCMRVCMCIYVRVGVCVCVYVYVCKCVPVCVP